MVTPPAAQCPAVSLLNAAAQSRGRAILMLVGVEAYMCLKLHRNMCMPPSPNVQPSSYIMQTVVTACDCVAHAPAASCRRNVSTILRQRASKWLYCTLYLTKLRYCAGTCLAARKQYTTRHTDGQPSDTDKRTTCGPAGQQKYLCIVLQHLDNAVRSGRMPPCPTPPAGMNQDHRLRASPRRYCLIQPQSTRQCGLTRPQRGGGAHQANCCSDLTTWDERSLRTAV